MTHHRAEAAKLWRIPNEWDYHELGAVFVVAPTRAAALAKAKRELKRKGREDRGGEYSRGSASNPDWDRIEVVIGGVWFGEGCDD